MPKKSTTSNKSVWLRHWDKILFIFVLIIFFLLYPGQNIYTVGSTISKIFVKPLPFIPPVPAPYPANKTGVYPGSEISAVGAVVQDLDSGVYLFRRNEDYPFSPASTTKIMTALVALDNYSLDDVVTVKKPVTEGQTINLVPGERITVENLLYGALIASGNDAAWALADNFPGGEQKFVEAMNQKAKAIHLTSTNFTNPVGFDDSNHKTTPKDLATLARVALENKIITKMVAIPQITISDVTHTYYHPLSNVNQLLGKIPGVAGIKTGWTEEAGENLVTLVERNGHRVIIVVLKSQDRFADTIKLIDWVFTNYEWQILKP